MSGFDFIGSVKNTKLDDIAKFAYGCLPFVYSIHLFKQRKYPEAAFWGAIDMAVFMPFALPFANALLKSISINSKLVEAGCDAFRLVRLSRTAESPVVKKAAMWGFSKLKLALNSYELCKPFSYAALSKNDLKMCAERTWYNCVRSTNRPGGNLYLNP